MEEEMLEQTNEYVDGTTEEIVEDINEDAEETTDNGEETAKVETPKTFNQDEVNSIVEDRIKRERKRLEREYRENLSKYQELAYLTQEGLKANDLEETLSKSREFYGKQGIKYVPNNNTEDEIVGKYYAKEIIDESDSLEDLENQAKKLSKKQNLSTRDEVVLRELNEEILNRKRITELKTIGVSEEEYNSNDFRAFEKNFTKETPIKDVYELYKLKHTEKPIDNPGSMKSIAGKENRGYISEAEYDKMSDKDIENNMDLIMKSMSKW